MDRRVLVLGSACLDWSSSYRAWIKVLERRVSRCAWIGIILVVLGSEVFLPCLDRSFRWNRESAVLGSKFQRGVWNRERVS